MRDTALPCAARPVWEASRVLLLRICCAALVTPACLFVNLPPPTPSCPQREKEARALAQRLEAATAQCGLLDDSVAALKKKAGELGTVLAQRDVAVRGLEDRLRALQARARGVAGGDGLGTQLKAGRALRSSRGQFVGKHACTALALIEACWPTSAVCQLLI